MNKNKLAECLTQLQELSEGELRQSLETSRTHPQDPAPHGAEARKHILAVRAVMKGAFVVTGKPTQIPAFVAEFAPRAHIGEGEETNEFHEVW